MNRNVRPLSLPQIVASAVLAIVAWSALGFSWFGYGFDWTTQARATQMAARVVTENLATICVAQARHAPGSDAALEQFFGLDSWKRREFLEAARWAVMPGSHSSRSGVVDRCAEKLLKS